MVLSFYMGKLAKKIKADIVINELEGAIENLEIKQRKAQTFFGKINDAELKDKLSYKFDKKDNLIKGLDKTRKNYLVQYIEQVI